MSSKIKGKRALLAGEPRSAGRLRLGASGSNTGGKKKDTSKAGARHIPHYYDHHEDYVPVNRQTLHELSTLGWLQEGAGASGMFFFSGAFWELVTILYEQHGHLSDYLAWILMCLTSIVFGLVLIWIGYRHFKMKQDRIADIFREHPNTHE